MVGKLTMILCLKLKVYLAIMPNYLKKTDGQWYLKDLGSTNGCKVNSEKIDDEKALKEGDLAAIGDQEFIVVKQAVVKAR